ncbi:hypothetical protein OHA37_27410 [Streptomyces sp. NBC_00335]|uniref:hypothetical protein n=1 Tax=unclassified Streptomyces TaxID=2593676 RepID=UPI0022584A7D|nr:MULTISPECIES: hypothetical protein [unclassified Streptomyces]MCX5407578.1 hypothetical protein [Streptomyces sp. NBC_00086]
MIEYVVLAGAAAGTGWLMRRKHLRRQSVAPVPGLPCMARRPAGAGRWRSGRVYADRGAARWVPGRGEPVALTGGRATGVRAPSVKEGISINPGSRIVTVEFAGDGGGMEIAVMPLDLRELLAAVEPADPDPAPEETA